MGNKRCTVTDMNEFKQRNRVRFFRSDSNATGETLLLVSKSKLWYAFSYHLFDNVKDWVQMMNDPEVLPHLLTYDGDFTELGQLEEITYFAKQQEDL